MRATAQSLGLSTFGNVVLMSWFVSTRRVSWRTLHTADISPPAAITHFIQSGAVRRMAGCPSWSRFGIYGPVVCSTKERLRCSTGSSAITAQSDISPSAYPLSAGGACSPSREFSFALHQIQQAIEPHLSLQKTLCSWNQIAQALAEKSRNRLLQLAKWRAHETTHPKST